MKTIPLLEPIAGNMERVESKLREPVHLYPQLTPILHSLLDSGGKRLRPALALLAGSIFEADQERLVSLAAAVEMLHTATLVHDDLVDGALMRRGSETLNSRWSTGATVLAGDYLFARAAALAAETRHVRVINIFAQTLMVICSGELRQIFDRHYVPPMDNEEDWKQALERYDERIYAKTASLFAAATEAAAILGSATEEQIRALRDYGQLLGTGFQIIDDLLDFQGNEATMGKPVGSDLREGIVTLPVLYYLREHPGDQRVATVVSRGADEALVAEVVADIGRSEALTKARERADGFIRRSQEALAALPEGEPRNRMAALAEYSVARRS